MREGPIVRRRETRGRVLAITSPPVHQPSTPPKSFPFPFPPPYCALPCPPQKSASFLTSVDTTCLRTRARAAIVQMVRATRWQRAKARPAAPRTTAPNSAPRTFPNSLGQRDILSLPEEREFKQGQVATKPTPFGKRKLFLLKFIPPHTNVCTHWLQLCALSPSKLYPDSMICGCRLMAFYRAIPDLADAPQFYHS